MPKRIRISLTNRYADVLTENTAVLTALREFWSFYPKGYRWAPAHKLWVRNYARASAKKKASGNIAGWDGKIRLLNKSGGLPAGLFRATFQEAETKLGVRFEIERHRPKVQKYLTAGFDSDKEHLYQDDCVGAMVANLRSGGGIVLSATGTGKTKVAGQFFSKLTCSCLFVVDQVDLLYQAQKELAFWLKEPIGVVGNSKYEVQRVTVATVQTLSQHLEDDKFFKWYEHVKVVVVDELHEQMARRNFKVLEAIAPLAIYGITATLQLKQKPVRYKAYSFAGPVIYEFPYAEARDKEVVSNGRVLQVLFAPTHDVNEKDDKRPYADQYEDEVLNHVEQKQACRKVTKYAIAQGYYVLIHVDRIKQVRRLARMFKRAEIDHAVAYGAVGKNERSTAIKDFEKGKIRLIIANKVFRKGINLKRVDFMIDMAAGKNPSGSQQKFGRGVRLHDEKELLNYVDFGATSGRFGKRAKIRARALKSLGVQLKKVVCDTPAEALAAVKKFLKGAVCKVPSQMKLGFE